jgi:glucan endo-1,3-alpha-glucosidase
MVGTLTPGSGHAEQDIDQAQAIGFDAFKLNVGSPAADWALNTTDQLFTYAASGGFKLFFSMDLGAEPDLTQFYDLLN